MKRLILLIAISIHFISAGAESPEIFTISGRVTYFNGEPVDSATIRLKNKSFENIYETLTDENGNYSLEVEEGTYFCLYASKMSDYMVNTLEYWTWNVPVYKDLIINPKYGPMEIYGIHVFEPRFGPYNNYMIYFRPMSLKKIQDLVGTEALAETNNADSLIPDSLKTINVAPNTITPDELTIKINGKTSKIVGINKITIYARGDWMYSYIVQVLKPEEEENNSREYDFISIILDSEETGETGKSETFVIR